MTFYFKESLYYIAKTKVSKGIPLCIVMDFSLENGILQVLALSPSEEVNATTLEDKVTKLPNLSQFKYNKFTMDAPVTAKRNELQNKGLIFMMTGMFSS